jgi:hypothetical protein
VRTLSRPQARNRKDQRIASKIIAKQSTLPLGTAQLAAWMGVAAVSQVLCFENFEKSTVGCSVECRSRSWSCWSSNNPGTDPSGCSSRPRDLRSSSCPRCCVDVMTERLPRIRTLDFSPLLKGHQSRPPRSGANQSYLNIMEVKNPDPFCRGAQLGLVSPLPAI